MLYPLSYEGIVPICRGFSSATAGPEYQSCEKVAKFAGNVRRTGGERQSWPRGDGVCGGARRPCDTRPPEESSLRRDIMGARVIFACSSSACSRSLVSLHSRRRHGGPAAQALRGRGHRAGLPRAHPTSRAVPLQKASTRPGSSLSPTRRSASPLLMTWRALAAAGHEVDKDTRAPGDVDRSGRRVTARSGRASTSVAAPSSARAPRAASCATNPSNQWRRLRHHRSPPNRRSFSRRAAWEASPAIRRPSSPGGNSASPISPADRTARASTLRGSRASSTASSTCGCRCASANRPIWADPRLSGVSVRATIVFWGSQGQWSVHYYRVGIYVGRGRVVMRQAHRWTSGRGAAPARDSGAAPPAAPLTAAEGRTSEGHGRPAQAPRREG